jgi:flagellar hook-length control protein FliK
MTAAISSFIAPPAPQAAPAPAPSQDTGFAKMLSARQAMASEAEPSGAPQASEEPTAPSKPAAARRQGTNGQAERTPAKAKTPDNTAPAREAGTPGAEATEATDSEPVDPALAEWMAALNLPAAPAPLETPATAQAQGEVPDGALAPTDIDTDTAAGKPGARHANDAALGASTRNEAAQDPADRLQAARGSREKPDALAAEAQPSRSAEWQAAQERVNASAESPARVETPSMAALGAAAPATGVARAAEPAAPAAPAAVSVPTPVTAPEFAQSLGVQVSVLARDGIQQAELHLNPADMGPISVQIALDGTQAQVNFGADSAATRQIIESGLPELAAALRDAGFTLSGGGVHSQARGRGEDGDAAGGSPSGRNGAPSETEVTPRHIHARVSAGGVDLYA